MRPIHICFIAVVSALLCLFAGAAYTIMNIGAFSNLAPGQVFVPVVSFGTIKILLWLAGVFGGLAGLAAYFVWNPSMLKSAFGKPIVTRRR